MNHRLIVTRRYARRLGVAAIGAVLLLQALNSAFCYGHSIGEFLRASAFFIAIPLLPAIVSLLLKNPLRAVTACALFAPWLLFAAYTDCVRPYAGGGASMVYVAVLMYGTVTSLVGALIGGVVTRWMRIEVA